MTLSLPAILDELACQDAVLGLFLMGAGIIFLLMGVRVFRLLIALSFGVAGFVIGGFYAQSPPSEILFGLLGATILGLISVICIKISVATLSGAWIGLVAMGIVDQLTSVQHLTWGVTALAAIAGFSLVYVIFNEMIAFTTSLEGTLLFIGGFVVFLSQSTSVWGHIRPMMVSNSLFAPFIVLAGTVTGFFLQLADLSRKRDGLAG